MIKIVGIDPNINDTKFSILKVNKKNEISMEKVVRVQPPSSFEGKSNEQINVIYRELMAIIEDKPTMFCLIEDYNSRSDMQHTKILTAKVIGVIEHICYELSYPLYTIRRSESKFALGLTDRANEVKMYNAIIEILGDHSMAISGCYSTGAAVHLYKGMKRMKSKRK